MIHRRRGPGFVLAMTLIIIVLISVVTFMAVNVATLETRTALQEYHSSRAMYAARAGLNLAMSNLATDYYWGQTPQNLTLDAGEGLTFTVTVEPHPNNSTNVQKSWKITSTGFMGEGTGQTQRTLVAFSEQESFARYAYFTDAERSTSGSVIHFISADQITGPTHTNGFFTMTGHPRFSEKVDSANGNDSMLTAGPPPTYSQNGQTTTDTSLFYHTGTTSYTANGPVALNNSPQFSFAGGQANIPLPTDPGLIRANATTTLSASGHNPNQTGNPTWAITYDETTGKVTNITRNGTSVSDTQAPPIYKLKFLSNGSVQVFKKTPGAQTFPSTPTQTITDLTASTIYVEGFALVEGTVKGRVTLGTQNSVHLTGNLTYADTNVDVMGIVSNDNIIVESPISTLQDRTIHASLMALNGSFTVDKYNSGSRRGTLHVLGGIIQKVRGPVGTFGSSGTISTGYAKDYRYDEKLINKPPLNFPTTGRVFLKGMFDQGAPGSLS